MIRKTLLLTGLAFMLAFTASAQRSNQESTTFSVNIDCQNCVNRITNQLAFERGVRDLSFDLEAQTVEVTYRNNRTDKEKLAEKIRELGFEVKEKKEEGDKAKAKDSE
ncbi:heavy-metal-associated domain-containing protein [Natronoflexus pectinivorans]|uniref:Copper chaperone CopZ n=1 Tax=Natronoflexus pectinivorans TaxID=682526 RepID=A0A4V2RWJ7_9BACT|nr:heavy-metal-associated domain-containing protein [Natronoflexus pectinivorans]TCO08738.1 copper chaperone CopZ [Natronoflexus pectinivorans]